MQRLFFVPLFFAMAPSLSARPAHAQAPDAVIDPRIAAPSPPAAGTRIVLRANRKNAVLERRAGSIDILEEDGDVRGSASLWSVVCVAPCQASIGAGEQLRVSGEGIEPSAPFKLDPRSRAVRIDADAGSQRALTWGKTLVSTGVGLAALGTVLLIIPSSGDDPDSSSAFKTLRGLGYGALGAGGALALVGIPLWAANGTTITVSSPLSSMGEPPSALVVGARRALF